MCLKKRQENNIKLNLLETGCKYGGEQKCLSMSNGKIGVCNAEPRGSVTRELINVQEEHYRI